MQSRALPYPPRGEDRQVANIQLFVYVIFKSWTNLFSYLVFIPKRAFQNGPWITLNIGLAHYSWLSIFTYASPSMVFMATTHPDTLCRYRSTRPSTPFPSVVPVNRKLSRSNNLYWPSSLSQIITEFGLAEQRSACGRNLSRRCCMACRRCLCHFLFAVFSGFSEQFRSRTRCCLYLSRWFSRWNYKNWFHTVVIISTGTWLTLIIMRALVLLSKKSIFVS